jgi:cobalt-zinc-cadmium efflux system membrane fusion protein
MKASIRCALVGLTLVACDKPGAKSSDKEARPALSASAEPSAHSADRAHQALPKRLTLTAEVIRDAKIRTEPASKQVLAETLALPGEITADPDRMATVASPVSGRLERVQFREGSTVKKGDALATLRVPDIARAKADYAASQAKSLAARGNSQRLSELAAKGLASEQEVSSAQADAAALQAQSRAADELLRAIGSGSTTINSELTLRAPLAGVVIFRNAVVGQPVATDQTIATIADLSEAWFLARVFEKDLGRLRTGTRAEVRLNAYSDQPFQGTVEYVGRQIDPTARTLTARIRVQNSTNLLSVGLFGTAFVETAAHEAGALVLVVPQTAIVSIGDKPCVFVREPGGDYLLHEVVLGAHALGKTQIVSGLREGEDVVVDGAFTLESIVLKSTFGEAD